MQITNTFTPAVSTKTQLDFVLLISAVAALGGLLFGYNMGVISGAIMFMQQRFALDPAMTGWIVSSVLVGSVAGASTAGYLSDRFGRKKILLLSAVLFIVSALATILPNDINSFVWIRMVAGLAIGISSMVSPMYIAEIAPANVRGRLVSFQQLAIVTGFFVVYFSNMAITNMGDAAWNVDQGWRWMFASAVIPSVLFLLLLFIVPETPRWLAKHGRQDEALGILTKIGGESYAQKELYDINNTATANVKAAGNTSISQLFQPGLRKAVFVACVLATLQQVTGINAIMYYAPIIFKNIGAGTDNAFLSTVMVGGVNLLFTILSLWLIDKAGRKALLLAGSIGMAISLGGVGTAFYLNLTQGPWVLLFILMFVASFAVSLGPVVWVLITEIFPSRVRGVGVSIATVVLWIMTFAVSQTFPMLLSSIGPSYTFWFYMSMAVFSVFFTWIMLPETKGLSLEEIEHLWVKKA